jgi:hypothetical protein
MQRRMEVLFVLSCCIERKEKDEIVQLTDEH